MATFSSNYSALLSLTGAGASDLATTLGVGNTTGGSDIEFSSGDGVVTTANGAGPGFDLGVTAGAAGGGNFDGGDLNLGGGPGAGTGVDGKVNILGDLVVTGSISLTNLLSGTLTPEGAVVAPVSTIFQRTDGGAGNSIYFKMSGAGNTGWCPAGPPVFDNLVSVGAASFMTSRAVFDDPTGLGVENLAVFWNGVLQREGGADDYTVVYGGAFATITFIATPPATDLVTLRYLPA